MQHEYNIYGDESCHLEHDVSNAMAIGAVSIPKSKRIQACRDIIEIKGKYGVRAHNEIKWVKARHKLLPLYKDLIDYFFESRYIQFRVLVVPDKSLLNHAKWNQTHNEWYYKMYFEMLKVLLTPNNKYNIYLDIKDTHSDYRVKQLGSVCANNMHDFTRDHIKKIQPIRSDESQLMQLTDILIGAVCRQNRDLDKSSMSPAKRELIDYIIKRSRNPLTKTTSAEEKKFNVFIWRAV
ncbi:DUF3800 domain-containing protein [Bifidobacterium sp. ESL0827]|uniref:DUF3800 domain-containing protein n=1 Tax=Bifidobacterium sp. ESL0827 TaxID=3448583 RepID=UPI0040410741